ncbi:hypothetical protein FKM82_023126 [Ascaphus truei]
MEFVCLSEVYYLSNLIIVFVLHYTLYNNSSYHCHRNPTSSIINLPKCAVSKKRIGTFRPDTFYQENKVCTSFKR